MRLVSVESVNWDLVGLQWGVGPHVHSHYIREFCYCYGAVDAHIGRYHESTSRCYTRTGEGGDKVHR